MGLSRLFAAANALVPFHKHVEEDSTPDLAAPDLKAVPDIDDKTLDINDPRLKAPVKLEIAPQQAPLFNPNRQLDPFPQFDPEAFKRSVDPAKDSVLPDDPKQKALGEESHYGTAVVVPNRKRKKAPATETQPNVGARTSITKLKRDERERKRDHSAKTLALLFFIPAIGLATYGIFATDAFTTSSVPAARKSALTPEQIQERLNYYRTTTGGKLNRDRIDVQIQNFQNAPALGAFDRKVKPPNVMDGLPLRGESNAKNTKDLPYDPTYSEAKIAYGLQEEQDRVEFEKRAREAWIQEFIANARKDGVDVQIDAFGNVTTRQLKPDEVGDPLSNQ